MSGIGGIGGGFGFGGFSNKFSGGQGGAGLADLLNPSAETRLLHEIKDQRENPNVKFKVKEEEKKREAAEQREQQGEQQAQQNADAAQQSQQSAAASQGHGQGQAGRGAQSSGTGGSGLSLEEGAGADSFNATMAEMVEAEKQKRKQARQTQMGGQYFSAAGLRQVMPERGENFVSPFISSDIYVRSETSAMRQAREYFAEKQTDTDAESALVPYSVTLLNEPDMAELSQDAQTALNYDRDRVSHVMHVMKKEQQLQIQYGEDIKVGFNMAQGRYEMVRPGDEGYQDVKTGAEIQSELSETFNRGYLDRQDFQGVFQQHNLYL